MGRIYGLLTGPRLYQVFGHSERTTNIVEYIGDNTMSLARGLFLFSTSLAFSPVVLIFLYSRGGFNIHTVLAVLKYTSYLAVLAFGGRLVGRTMDYEYRQFINIWLKARYSGKYEDNQALKRYDFDLDGVNADFTAVPNKNLWYHQTNHINGGPVTMCAAWYAIHAFGRHMLYPGSIALLNWLLNGSLLSARNLMVSTKQGHRAWLRSAEGDLVDTMFIRGEDDNPEKRNQILVISCEGNAGYYEIGIANTPSQLGYSVLGWNQPGFGQSSGLPFPKNTLAAADAVMQYAQNVLGFREEDIVLFGWSIGGFPASWLAANYPTRMPRVFSDVVEYAIRTHFDLNIQAIIARYKGPIKLIRRLQEEMLTTVDTGTEAERRASNRANFLLKNLLHQRHPTLIVGLESQVDRWLEMSPQHRAMALHPSNESELAIRRAQLFAACDHYFTDFDATHVQPLDPRFFNVPTPIHDLKYHK